MHLIFLHGVPGVGKRTIAMELSRELGFPFLNFKHLVDLLGPVFGYSSPNFNSLRDEITAKLINQVLASPEDGIIASFTYEPTIPLEDYRQFIEAAKNSGGIGVFVGLTCDDDELLERVQTPDRRAADREDTFQLMDEASTATMKDVPQLPGPAITINTSGESPEQTVQNIIAMLPDDMKSNISI